MKFAHIVYLIEFCDRKSKNIKPYYYIGSKSNCSFDGINIIDKNGKFYYGSSKHKEYKVALTLENNLKIHVLYNSENYEDCIAKEKDLHILNDVVADTCYWNLSIATICNYSDPNYGTFKHTIDNKVARLDINHPDVISGDYVGISKNKKWYNNGILNITCCPDQIPENFVLGRCNTENFKKGDDHYMRTNPLSHSEVISRCNNRSENMRNEPEKYEPGKKNQRDVASKTHKGVKKSAESNKKRSRPGMIVLKNIHTGDCIRIYKTESHLYDLSVWKNPSSLADKKLGGKWYTNGEITKTLYPDDMIPDGFVLGRKIKN